MKKFIIIPVFLLIATFAKAQDDQRPPSKEDHLKHVNEMLKKELQLNDAQQKQAGEVFKDFLDQAEQLHKQYPPPPPPPMDPKMKEAFDKIEQARDAKMKTILTDDQYKKYSEVKIKMHPPHPDQPPPHKGQPLS